MADGLVGGARERHEVFQPSDVRESSRIRLFEHLVPRVAAVVEMDVELVAMALVRLCYVPRHRYRWTNVDAIPEDRIAANQST